MSDFSRPGGSTAGTAVDPGSAGGVLIDPSEITQPGVWAPGSAPPGYVLETDGIGGWLIVPNSATARSIDVSLHHNAGVPDSGIRFLRFGQSVITSLSGFRLPATGGVLKGLTIQTQNSSANDYQVQLLSDPSGRAAGPTAIAGAVLSLPAGSVFARDRSLSIAVADLELGVWVLRTAGAATGTQLDQISVIAEFELAAP